MLRRIKREKIICRNRDGLQSGHTVKQWIRIRPCPDKVNFLRANAICIICIICIISCNIYTKKVFRVYLQLFLVFQSLRSGLYAYLQTMAVSRIHIPNSQQTYRNGQSVQNIAQATESGEFFSLHSKRLITNVPATPVMSSITSLIWRIFIKITRYEKH